MKFKKALLYFKKALSIAEELDNNYGRTITNNNIAHAYYNQKLLDSALFHFKISLEIARKLEYSEAIITNLENIGNCYKDKGHYNEALKNFTEAIKLAEEFADPTSLLSLYGSIGETYLHMGNLPLSEEYFLKQKKVSQTLNLSDKSAVTHQNLYNLFLKKKDYKNALDNYILFIGFRDSVTKAENNDLLLEKQFDFEYKMKSKQDSLSHAKEKEIQRIQLEKKESEISANNRQKALLFGGLIITMILVILIFKRFKLSQKQKSIIENQKMIVEEKNQEITDSINYAKRIQAAILPPQKLVKEYLPESFILYKPKDIVAGDFYWMETITGQGIDTILFATCDCTGHGVPGAMVSVVCNNGLNRAVREFGLTDPGKILDKTREIVIQEFEKSEEEVKDGMDVSLVAFSDHKIKWAGANNPLWLLRNGELIEFKANKQPIGKYSNPTPFTTHEIELLKGDTIYIFTDGLQDQFGGEKGKKLKTKAFKELLLSIQDKNMSEQRNIIDETFETWKGNLEQNDDVCVIGVRI